MNIYGSPTIAMAVIRQHQADIRAAFPRRTPLPVTLSRAAQLPWPTPTYGGVTAVPALADEGFAEPSAQQRDGQPETTAA